MESDLSSHIVHEDNHSTIISASQMPRTPEPSPFKRPAMSFAYSPRPDSSSGYVESRPSSSGGKKAPSLSGILSPPPSPFVARQVSEAPSELEPTIHTRDPLLYDTPSSEENHPPLFPPSEPYRERSASAPNNNAVVEDRRVATSRPVAAKSQQATAPSFRSSAWQDCFRNPSEFFRRERAYLKQQALSARAARTVKPLIHVIAPKPVTPGPRKSHHSHSRSRSSGSEIILTSPRERVRTQKVLDNNSKVVKPKFSRQSKPVTTTRKDIHYSTVEDVTPSTDLLPDNPRCLHVEWSGAPLDISNDPDRDQLHKAEQHLASTLKLSCGQYLTQKRLIFLERVTRLRAGNTVFSRTHAQQVCHIDVNKASRLFAAFEKVGWLSPQALKQHL
ncbi:hypothetical protein Dda_4615 [Drechslerella dactyloides]|uniref:SWIRM domain-containing protein n=1 Tax=Drechslerella dactyloides TaxID=74499 RepID=A0AAD6IYM0_DREDA|nr:hypothetical protein Dda_4615 [Drechslerella dactyloides]